MGRIGWLLNAAALDVEVVCMFRIDAECAKSCCTGYFCVILAAEIQVCQGRPFHRSQLWKCVPIILVELAQSSHARDLLKSVYLFRKPS